MQGGTKNQKPPATDIGEDIFHYDYPLALNMPANYDIYLVQFGVMWFAAETAELAKVLLEGLTKLFQKPKAGKFKCELCKRNLPTLIDYTFHRHKHCMPIPKNRKEVWTESFPTAFFCAPWIVEFLEKCLPFENGPQPLLDVAAWTYPVRDGQNRHTISTGSFEVGRESANCNSDTVKKKSIMTLAMSKVRFLKLAKPNPKRKQDKKEKEEKPKRRGLERTGKFILSMPFLLPLDQWPKHLRDELNLP